MTKPLNDDGTVPLKRRFQVTMRLVEGKNTLIEVSRDIKPQWQQVADQCDDSSMTPLNLAELVDPCAQAIGADARDAVLSMAQELILKVHGGS